MAKEKEKKDIIQRIKRRHGWKVLTIMLFALLIISMFTGGFKDFFGYSAIGSKKAVEHAVEFINSDMLQGGATASLKEITDSEVDFLYKFKIDIAGQTFPSYVTKDGKYIIPQELIDITEKNEQVETPDTTGVAKTQTPSVPKSDKPVVEAFVFSYCPYGLQFQKALLPVYKLLKNKADITLIAIGAMHGEYEKQESLRQICIEEKYSKDKLWAYLEKFMTETKIGNCRGDMACSDPLVEQVMTQLGIDKDMVNDCMATDAESLYTSQNIQADGLGISGSPTFVINGAKIQVGRSPEAIKEVVCNAFNTPPGECEQTISAATASPGFGSGTSTSAGSC